MAHDADILPARDLSQLQVVGQRLQEEFEGVVLTVDLVLHLAALDDRLSTARVVEGRRRGRQPADLQLRDLGGVLGLRR